ncbi:uncharacterized protein LOC142984354 [Anticarsia gemmatalis]|uniref:uncharacterized protein LOC142984354 n=1 Tax=Anticarsia gemmatalis TaxID=129554 RepID=UPI003F76C2D0
MNNNAARLVRNRWAKSVNNNDILNLNAIRNMTFAKKKPLLTTRYPSRYPPGYPNRYPNPEPFMQMQEFPDYRLGQSRQFYVDRSGEFVIKFGDYVIADSGGDKYTSTEKQKDLVYDMFTYYPSQPAVPYSPTPSPSPSPAFKIMKKIRPPIENLNVKPKNQYKYKYHEYKPTGKTDFSNYDDLLLPDHATDYLGLSPGIPNGSIEPSWSLKPQTPVGAHGPSWSQPTQAEDKTRPGALPSTKPQPQLFDLSQFMDLGSVAKKLSYGDLVMGPLYTLPGAKGNKYPWRTTRAMYPWQTRSVSSVPFSPRPEFVILPARVGSEKVNETQMYVDNFGQQMDDQVYYEGDPLNNFIYEGIQKKKKSQYSTPLPLKTTDHYKHNIIKKRDAPLNTYTAKDVAALEVIVDLMKNTVSYEDKISTYWSGSGVFGKPTKGVPLHPDGTNSIQVHIEIPYDTQFGKKRSPLEPLRVRKVFSAKMSTPVDLEYQVHSFESSGEVPVTDASAIDSLSPGMYLLVDKPKDGYALKPVTAKLDLSNVKPRQLANSSSNGETTRPDDMKSIAKVTLSKNFIAAVNKQLIEMYDNITRSRNSNIRQARSNKDEDAEKKGYRYKKIIDWDAIKRYFGDNDRVCNCKCKPNKTMCRACAASDAVIEELVFEFENLGQYMKDHCTEIQTFFSMNPSGGLKLRDAVHKIDRSLQDYSKRVRGKCQGRTCKTLGTCIDKRQVTKTLKVVKETVVTQLMSDLLAVADDLNKTLAMKACINKKLKHGGDKMMRAFNGCISRRIFQKRCATKKKKFVKNVYSLDSINVNIICNPTESYGQSMNSGLEILRTTDGIYDYTVDEKSDKKKKRKGLRNLFPKRNKKDKGATSLNKSTKSSKRSFKRETESQIEVPLISDTGGNFWVDYINRGKDEVRQARDMKPPDIVLTSSTPKSFYSVTGSVIESGTVTPSKNTNMNFWVDYITSTKKPRLAELSLEESTSDKFSITDAEKSVTASTFGNGDFVSYSEKSIREDPSFYKNTHKEYFESTTDFLTYNINQLLHLFGSLQESDINSLGNSTLLYKSEKHSTVKMRPADPNMTEVSNKDDVKTTIDVKPLTESKKTDVTETKTTMISEATKKLTKTNKQHDFDIPKSTDEMQKILDDKISHYHSNMFNITKENELTTANVKNKASTLKTEAEEAEKIAIISGSETSTSATRTSTPKATKRSTKPTTLKKTTTKPTTKTTTLKPRTTGKTTATTNKMTITIKPSKKGFFSKQLETTMKFLGLSKKPQKDSRDTEHVTNAMNIITLQDSTSCKNPTILIINEYDNNLNDEALSARNKNPDGYKNLLLSIIQYETNRLNDEWQRIAYGNEPANEEGYKRSIDLEGPRPTFPSIINKNLNESPLKSIKTKIMGLIPDIDIPEPKEDAEETKHQGFLKKFARKMGMKIVPCKKNDKAVKQSNISKFVDIKVKAKQNYYRDPEANELSRLRRTICDLQATFNRVTRLHKQLNGKSFESFVKNIPCFRRKRLKKSLFVHYRSGGMKWDWVRSKRSIGRAKLRSNGIGGIYCDVYETFVKGDDGIYRIVGRKKRNAARRAMDVKLRILPRLKTSENDRYVMVGDSVTLDCRPRHQRTAALRPRYSWKTDRKNMLDHDNVEVDEFTVTIKKAGARNSGRYTCQLDQVIQKDIRVNVVTLPAFDMVFLPTYRTKSECTYEDLKAIQHLGHTMSKEIGCGNVCSIRIDEPMCQLDRGTNHSVIKSTAVLSMIPQHVKCSVQCRRDLLSSLVRLAVANLPALARMRVVLNKDGVNETLRPCRDISRPMATHVLRKKDSSGHREYHKLSSRIQPGQIHMVTNCDAGFYLLPSQKICVSCPANTSSSVGDNTCTPCPTGTSSEPGATRCHGDYNRLRRYEVRMLHVYKKKLYRVSHNSTIIRDRMKGQVIPVLGWWWYPPCGYAMACVAVVCACSCCVALALMVHLLSRAADEGEELRAARATKPPEVVSRYVHAARRPLSPSRVILARFFRPSLTSSRATAVDSQETKFELWKERNIPPPLPPIDFDSNAS